MTVRDAKFGDIPRLAAIYADCHQRSAYRDVELDLDEAKKLLAQSVQRHGQRNYGGTLVLVAEKGEQVEGFIIGFLDQPYPAIKALMATDLLFLGTPQMPPADALEMVKRVIEWGRQNPKVVEVFMGVSGAIGHWSRTSVLYERAGLEPWGAMFRRGFER